MADYRLSAQIISRGKGQSSIASAAYRTATRLDDPRTGEAHDFTRKRGVVFSEVLAPDNAPDWMRDRAKLWQAVEAAEKRKDAQLAREVQLSLPHELTQEQRVALLVGFAREQFVDHGMIADVALHLPGREGDDRNHHAHIMLTTRSLTGEGFGNKARDWNDPAKLAEWREAWARHQNRELERHGHAARVDHRSYEEQGIDREPAQHMGPTAADMERNGKPSRIGDENRVRGFNNAARSERYREHFSVDEQRRQFDVWAHEKAGQIRASTAQQIEATGRTMDDRHRAERDQLAARMRQQYGTHQSTITREVETLDRRLQATGARKLFRDLFGRTKGDSHTRDELARTLRTIEQRQADRLRILEHRQRQEVDAVRRQAVTVEQKRLAGIDRHRQEREGQGWQPKPPVTAPKTPVQQAFAKAAHNPAPNVKPSPQPAPEARKNENPAKPDAPAQPARDWWRKGDARPADPADQARPWRSDPTRGPDRER